MGILQSSSSSKIDRSLTILDQNTQNEIQRLIDCNQYVMKQIDYYDQILKDDLFKGFTSCLQHCQKFIAYAIDCIKIQDLKGISQSANTLLKKSSILNDNGLINLVEKTQQLTNVQTQQLTNDQKQQLTNDVSSNISTMVLIIQCLILGLEFVLSIKDAYEIYQSGQQNWFEMFKTIFAKTFCQVKKFVANYAFNYLLNYIFKNTNIICYLSIQAVSIIINYNVNSYFSYTLSQSILDKVAKGNLRKTPYANLEIKLTDSLETVETIYQNKIKILKDLKAQEQDQEYKKSIDEKILEQTICFFLVRADITNNNNCK